MLESVFSDKSLENAQKDNDKLTINKEYAKHYQKINERAALSRKQGNLYAKLAREIDGEDGNESDSTSETEDEDGDLLTMKLDVQIHRTLNAIRNTDSSILKKTTQFYDEDDEQGQKKTKQLQKKTKKRKNALKSVLAKQLLEDAANISDSESDTGPRDFSLIEEERKRKLDFRKKVEQDLNDNDDDDDFFTVKNKDNEDKDGKENKNEDDAAFMELMKNYENSTENKFLHDFFLNHWWKDKNRQNIPSYEEIRGEHEPIHPGISEDEDILDEQEEFETKYNFRFEEEDSSQIITYPRNIEGTLRKENSKRKPQRESKLKRKEEEKKRKAEELRRLKSIKRKEVMEKIKQIQEITGDKTIEGADHFDIDKGFNPSKYDHQMESMFGDEYYNDANYDAEKEEAAIEAIRGKIAEEDMQEMFDFKPQRFLRDSINKIKKKRKKEKKKNIVAESSESQAILNNYLEELYKMDYEDLIGGDIPCRFKYTTVPKCDYGLTVEEIFTSSDKDLTQKIPIKKLAPYRTDKADNTPWWMRKGNRKPKNLKKGGIPQSDSYTVGEEAEALWEDGKYYTVEIKALTKTGCRVTFKEYDEISEVPLSHIRKIDNNSSNVNTKKTRRHNRGPRGGKKKKRKKKNETVTN